MRRGRAVFVLAMAVMLSLAFAAQAFGVVVSGTVKSDATGLGIPFAHVWVTQGVLPPVADVEADWRGVYSLDVPADTYTFNASGPGWEVVSEDDVVVESDVTKDFTLDTQFEQAVYRFLNMHGGVYFFSANDQEFMNTYASLARSYHYEGIAYLVAVGTQETLEDYVPLYRFYNFKQGVHFYTSSETEMNNVKKFPNMYRYEGVAYMVRNDGVGVPVLRYYNPRRNIHFYTVNSSEMGFTTLQSRLPDAYHFEGIAFYVADRYK